MKTRFPLLKSPVGLAVMALAVSPLSAAESVEASFLPAETLFLVEVADFPTLGERAEKSPLGQMLSHEKLREYLAPFWTSLREEFSPGLLGEDYGDRLRRHLTGRVVLALAGPEDGDWEEGEPQVAIILDFTGGEEDFAGLLDPFSDKHLEGEEGLSVSLFEEEFLGQTLHLEEVVADGELLRRNGWAQVGQRIVLAHPDTFLREVVAGVVEDGLRGSLRDSAAFQDAAFRAVGADIRVFFNLAAVLPLVTDGLREGLELANAGMAADGGMPPVSIDGVLRALALETFTGLDLSLRLEEEASIFQGALGFEPGRGLGRIFAYGSQPPSAWRGVPAAAVNASAASFNFDEVYRFVMEALGLANPGLAMMATMQMSQMHEQMGFHPGQDVFENISGELHSFTLPDNVAGGGGSPGQVYAVTVRDPARLTLALENLKNMTGAGGFFERQDVGETAVFRFQHPLEPDTDQFITYAVTDQHLLIGIGREALLAGLLQESAASFWERGDIAALFDQHPAGVVGRDFADWEFLMEYVLDALEEVMPADMPVSLDPALRPVPSDFPFVQTSTTHRESNGLSFLARIVPKSQLD